MKVEPKIIFIANQALFLATIKLREKVLKYLTFDNFNTSSVIRNLFHSSIFYNVVDIIESYSLLYLNHKKKYSYVYVTLCEYKNIYIKRYYPIRLIGFKGQIM